ncbi:MAG: universal stress protein [Slackia sp.]
MKLETILVPYDGSEQAKRALEYAKDLAAIAGGACCVRAVHVMPSDLINEKDLDGSSLEGVPLGLLGREEYQGLLNKVVDRARERVKEGLQDVIDEMGDSSSSTRRRSFCRGRFGLLR